jgi:hypothetical protein
LMPHLLQKRVANCIHSFSSKSLTIGLPSYEPICIALTSIYLTIYLAIGFGDSIDMTTNTTSQTRRKTMTYTKSI